MILVSGAAGLLGRELVGQLIAEARPVRGVDLSPCPGVGTAEWVAGDLLDEGTCRRACEGARVVIHTAARQYHSGVPRWGREHFFRANVMATRNLVGAALAAGAGHFIFISSDMVYGMPRGRPMREVDPPRPVGPYGRSKLACERLCAAARADGLRVTILRPRLILGPGRLGVLRRLFDRVRLGRPVPMLGDGRNRYQMVAAADVAAACRLAVEQPCDAVLNLGSSDPPTVGELLAGLCRRAGTGATLRALPLRPALAALWTLHGLRLAPLSPEQFRIAGVDYVLNTDLARQLLGWEPRRGDGEMMASAYDSYLASTAARQRPATVGTPATLRPRPAS
jgi:dTDP-glucose 4,6-dehydratase